MFGVSGSDASSAGDNPVKRKRESKVKAIWRRLFTPDSNWQATSKNARNPVMYENPSSHLPTPVAFNHPVPWHGIETDNGSLLIFCTEVCLNSYTINVLAEDENYASVKRAPATECVYCHWCSIRIHQPDTCFTHGDHCPIVSWKYTHQAVECYNELFCLFAATGLAIPAEILDDVEDVAEMYGPDLPGRAIARIAYKGWEFFQ